MPRLTSPMTAADWQDYMALVRESVLVKDAAAAQRLATAALADPDRCGRVLLALIKERGLGTQPGQPDPSQLMTSAVMTVEDPSPSP